MFGIGTGEIILILVIAMLVVGPERMVEFSRTAGTMLARFRRETDSVTSEFREALDLDPIMDAVNTTKEAATEVEQALKSTQEIAKGEVESAQEVVKSAAEAIPSTSIAPSSSAFADSQVTRTAASRHAGAAPTPAASTTLAQVEAVDAKADDSEDVYEVTELDGPELIDDVEVETAGSTAPSEG